jgi:hypothetical protein
MGCNKKVVCTTIQHKPVLSKVVEENPNPTLKKIQNGFLPLCEL